MDLATVKRLYNACNPAEPLAPNDARNIDVDSERFGRPRGVIWSETIAREITLSEAPVCKLFTGLPGSGKSTELRRLQRHLQGDSRFLTVLIDADERIDLTSQIDVTDIVAVVVNELERAVIEAEGGVPDQEPSSYFKRLWERIKSADPRFKEAHVVVPGAKFLVEMKSNPTFRKRVRDALSGHLTEFLSDAREYVEMLNTRARKDGWNGLVVVFDSLEKLRGMSTTWEAVIESAERVFNQGAPHLQQLPVHAVYTVPAALLSRQTNIEFMPAVKVMDREGQRSEPGIQALDSLVNQRIPAAEREAIFGSKDQQRALIDRIILRSGGYLRALVRTLQWCVAESVHPIDDERLSHRFASETDAFRRIVAEAHFDRLARVATEKYLPLGDDGHRSMNDRLLATSVVLRYQNEHDWWDLHPAVAEIPGVQAAIKRQRDS